MENYNKKSQHDAGHTGLPPANKRLQHWPEEEVQVRDPVQFLLKMRSRKLCLPLVGLAVVRLVVVRLVGQALLAQVLLWFLRQSFLLIHSFKKLSDPELSCQKN